MSNKSSDGRSGTVSIPSPQDKDAAGIPGERKDNSVQERDSDYKGQTDMCAQNEESRSEMKPSPVIPHGSVAVDTDKKGNGDVS